MPPYLNPKQLAARRASGAPKQSNLPVRPMVETDPGLVIQPRRDVPVRPVVETDSGPVFRYRRYVPIEVGIPDWVNLPNCARSTDTAAGKPLLDAVIAQAAAAKLSLLTFQGGPSDGTTGPMVNVPLVPGDIPLGMGPQTTVERLGPFVLSWSLCVRGMCPQPTTPKWRLVTLRIDSNPATPPILAWTDFQLAAAWSQWAKAYARDEEKIANLDLAPVDSRGSNPAVLAAMYETQVAYLENIFQCIANAYNALNIPWYTDPDARALYRKYMSGTDSAMELRPMVDTDYNEGNWYSKRETGDRGNINPYRNYPILRKSGEGSDARGIIPREALELATALKGSDSPALNAKFFVGAGLRLRPIAGEKTATGKWKDPVLDETGAINEGFAVPRAFGYLSTPVGATKSTATGPGVDLPQLERDPPARDADRAGDKHEWVDRINDWRTFTYTWQGTTDTYLLAAPLRAYLKWAQEWADSIAARTPRDILRAARLDVIKRNTKMLQTNYSSPEEYFESIGARDADINEWASRPQAGLKQAADTVAAVGGPLAAGATVINPVAGAAIGLIMGVGNGVLTLLSVVLGNDQPPENYGKDDLGRWKPIFERAFLSGATQMSELDEVADVDPSDQQARIPPGFCYVTPDPDDVAEARERETPPPPGSGGLDDGGDDGEVGLSPAAIAGIAVASVAGVAALGLLGRWLLSRREKPRGTLASSGATRSVQASGKVRPRSAPIKVPPSLPRKR